MHLGVLEVLKNLRVTFGFLLDDSYTFQLCLGFHPLVGMLRKPVLLFSMNLQVLI